MGDKILLGPLTFISWALGIVLTGAVTWLGIIDWEIIKIPFIVIFLGGIVLLLVATKLGITKETVWSTKVLFVVAGGLIVLMLQTILLQNLFTYEIASFDNVLVGVLFAIYEETVMLGFAAMLKAAGLPDIWIIILSVAFFVPMHAFSMLGTFFFDLFLTIGRVVMTSATLITDNSDTGYAIHIIWNVLASI